MINWLPHIVLHLHAMLIKCLRVKKSMKILILRISIFLEVMI